MKETRLFTRVPFKSEVLINSNGHWTKGESENLSLYGLYVKTIDRLDLNCAVELTIPLSGVSDANSIDINGIVVRHDETGIGVRFCQVDVDTFIELKNIVGNSCGNEKKIMDEFYHYISHKDSFAN